MNMHNKESEASSTPTSASKALKDSVNSKLCMEEKRTLHNNLVVFFFPHLGEYYTDIEYVPSYSFLLFSLDQLKIPLAMIKF